MKSSRMYNAPVKSFAGLHQQSLYYLGVTFVVGIMLIGFFSMALSKTVIFFLFGLVLFSCIKAYRFSEDLIKGSYYFQGKEIREVDRILKKSSWPKSVDFSSMEDMKLISFSKIKEKFSNLELGYDENSLYRLKVSSYDEVFGFDLSQHKSESDENYGLYNRDYLNIFQSILRTIPELSSAQLIRHSILEQNEEIKKRRPVLIEKKAQRVKYYVIFGLDSKLHDSGQKHSILNRLNGFRRLTKKELNAYNNLICAPKTPPSGRNEPLATAESDGNFISCYHDDYTTGAASLAFLPAKINANFGEYYSSFAGVENTVAIRYMKKKSGNPIDILKRTIQQRRKDEGKASYSDIQQIEREEKRQFKDDDANFDVDVNILLSGEKEKVQAGISALQSFELKGGGEDHEQAKFFQLKGYVEEAVKSCLLGTKATYVKTRLHNVKSYRECALYGTYPKSNSYDLENSTLLLRNEDNAIESIDLFQSFESLFTLVFGVSGSGKSTLFNLFTRVNDERYEKDGIRTYTVANDIGGSLKWRVGYDPEGSVAFDLVKDSNNNWTPFPCWPLEALMFEGGISDGDIDAGKNFICNLLGLDPDNSSESGDVEIITNSVRKLTQSEKPLRLSNLLDFVKEEVEILLKGMREGNIKDKVEESWRHWTAHLKKYTKNGEFGKAFDAETSNRIDPEIIRFWYFNIDSTKDRQSDIVSGFLGFSYALTFALGERYGPKSKVIPPDQTRTLLMLEDEADWKKEAIKQTSLTSIPDQCRKFDIVPILAFQQMQYVLDFNEDAVKSVGRFFFYQAPTDDEVDDQVVKKLVKTKENRQKLYEMGHAINEDYKEKEIYSVGYYSDRGTLTRLFVDIEQEFLWLFSSHAGAADLRNLVMAKGFTRKEAANLLAKYGPTKLPRKKQTNSYYTDVLNNIEKGIDG